MSQYRPISKTRGFTLIELMITIAIVAILVALAVPAYRDYTIRAKIAECINNAAVAKVQVSEYRQALGEWPASAEEAGISAPAGSSQFCSGYVNYESGSGAFTINVNEAAIDAALGTLEATLTPTETSNGIINWACSRGTTASSNVKYLPSSCRGT